MKNDQPETHSGALREDATSDDRTVNFECMPTMVYIRTEDRGVIPISRDDIAAFTCQAYISWYSTFASVYSLEVYLRDGTCVESIPLSYDEMYRGWGSLNTFEFSGYESPATHNKYQFRREGHWRLTDYNEVLYQNAGEWVKMFEINSTDWLEAHGLFDYMEKIWSDKDPK